MWRRGADPDGYVANFVETEQIVQMNGFTASFVQVTVTTFLISMDKTNMLRILASFPVLALF